MEKSSILDVQLCSEYVSEFSCKQSLGWQGTGIYNMHEKSTKNQSATEGYRFVKCETMGKNVKCFHCQ